MHIPMSAPDVTEQEVRAVQEVLSSRFLSIGPQVEAFEAAFAEYVGTPCAVAVSSGTAGLHLAVLAAGVRDGDFVITTPFSFVASANVLLYERATPVFVDVDPLTGNIDAAAVERAVSDLRNGGGAAAAWLPKHGVPQDPREPGERLKAVLPVHAFGQPADLRPLGRIADEHGLALIEDACEAIGAEYEGRRVGAVGRASVFAFYPNKQMTTGEGGMVVTRDPEWAQLCRSLRNQGRDPGDAWLCHTRLGYNYRLDEMSAALGRAQLSRLDEMLEKRARVAAWYTQRLTDVPELTLPRPASCTTRMSWFVYVVRIGPERSRDAVMTALAARGIPTRPYFVPIHLQPFYRSRFGYAPGDFPQTEAWGASAMALPFSGVMTEAQVDRVCTELRTVLRAEP